MLKKVSVIATTDVHSNIWGYNYEINEEMPECGMANIFTYIEKVRKENPCTFLLDNGDMIQGTLLTDDLYNKEWKNQHPLAVVMNLMGYDLMNLGNHEFNINFEILRKFQAELDFPVISANTIYKVNGKNFVKPYEIVEKEGVKIGVIGLITPMVSTWVGNKAKELLFLEFSQTTQRYIAELKGKVHLIMVIAHASLDGEIDPAKDAARIVLECCPEINGLVVGHFHITLKEEFNKILVAGATDKGREIIHFDFYLNENNVVVQSEVNIVDMANYKPSSTIRNHPIIEEAHKRTINLAYGTVIGRALKDFQPKNEIYYIPQGRLEETPVVQLINKVQKIYSNADVTATSLIRENCNILKGDITYGTICGIYKFDTQLYIIEVTGRELKAYLEWSASAYNQIKRGDISVSFSVDIPSYQHDLFSGINFEIDLTKPTGSRIVNVVFKGQELNDEELIKLAVSDYCYYTTLVGKGIVNSKPIWKSEKLIKELLVDYVKSHENIAPELENNWRIIGLNKDDYFREKLIEDVNKGIIEVPYNKSLNIFELKSMYDVK